MKTINMKGMKLVHSGDNWPFEQLPCNREMMKYLEKNEKVVTWMQPENGGVGDQFPAIRIHNSYYTLSLRMMKAIWRHVRLRRGFVNVERAPYGGLKLKIPSLLFTEKMRTQTRFNMMRMEESQGPVKERKVVQNASSKVSLVVQRMLLPLLESPMRGFVVFEATPDDSMRELMDTMRQNKPELIEDRAEFLEHMGRIYDEFSTTLVDDTPKDSSVTGVNEQCEVFSGGIQDI